MLRQARIDSIRQVGDYQPHNDRKQKDVARPPMKKKRYNREHEGDKGDCGECARHSEEVDRRAGRGRILHAIPQIYCSVGVYPDTSYAVKQQTLIAIYKSLGITWSAQVLMWVAPLFVYPNPPDLSFCIGYHN